MSTTTTNVTKSTTRPSTFTKSQWDKATYTAYMNLIAVVKGEKSVADYLKDNSALFTLSGVPADEKHVLSLVISMARDTTVDHEKVRKVNPIGSLRQYFNGGWSERDALDVRFKAPAQPKESKPRTVKPKKSAEETVKEYFGQMTAEQKAQFIASLMGEMAA